MIPIKLTENDYINPESVCRLHFYPKTGDRRAAIIIVFTDENLVPMELDGAYGDNLMYRILKMRHAAKGTL